MWKYGLTLPAKVEPGVKYPVFIGNMGWTLATNDSQAQYPCYVLGVPAPQTLLKAKPDGKGYDAPTDYKTVIAAAYKAVLEKVLGEYPNMDPSCVWVEARQNSAPPLS